MVTSHVSDNAAKTMSTWIFHTPRELSGRAVKSTDDFHPILLLRIPWFGSMVELLLLIHSFPFYLLLTVLKYKASAASSRCLGRPGPSHSSHLPCMGIPLWAYSIL